MRTGYFSDVTITKERIDVNNINLIVNVKEASTGSLRVGGGYQTYNGFLFDASISDLNIFGTGISTRLGLSLSKRIVNYSFDIRNPRIMDSEYSASFNISKNKYVYRTYVQDSYSIGVSFGKSFTDFIHAYIGYSYSNNEIDANESANVTNGYKSAFTGEDLKYVKSSINIGVKLQ